MVPCKLFREFWICSVGNASWPIWYCNNAITVNIRRNKKFYIKRKRLHKEWLLRHTPNARNEKLFKATEFSWNWGTSINIHLKHKKGATGRFYMKNFIHGWPQSGIFVLQIRAIFPIFERVVKSALGPPPQSFLSGLAKCLRITTAYTFYIYN